MPLRDSKRFQPNSGLRTLGEQGIGVERFRGLGCGAVELQGAFGFQPSTLNP